MSHDILIVDDEDDIRLLICGILDDEGYRTREAVDADTALAAINAQLPDLVILDIWMEGSRLDGIGVLQEIKKAHPLLPVIMISGHGTVETAVSALKQGAYDFIEKPFQSDRLLVLAERAIEAGLLRKENAALKEKTSEPDEELLGMSSSLSQVRQAVIRVAPTGSRVLISGAAGVGKEIVARQIHAQSKRATAPFIVVNCAAMHPERMEHELFGVEPGVESPESGRKTGLFEQAHTGTLLLDEIADLPLQTQGKIVRVLQDQTFEPVGGNRRISVDVRVIATSNRDLSAQIGEGKFREDLYYRLNVVPIHMPSLYDRRDDIPTLASYFMDKSAKAAGMAPRPFKEDAITALQAYDWPGNVRQLRNMMDWLLVMAPGESRDPIGADMLPLEVGRSAPASLSAERTGEIMTLSLREARERFERDYLEAQVARFGGNISRTASFVGMERSALHRKLKTLGLTGATAKG